MALSGGTIALIVVAAIAAIGIIVARKKLYSMVAGPSMDDDQGYMGNPVGGSRRRRRRHK